MIENVRNVMQSEVEFLKWVRVRVRSVSVPPTAQLPSDYQAISFPEIPSIAKTNEKLKL